VSRSKEPSLSFRLLQAALLPDLEARAVWRSLEPELDLDDHKVGGSDVFAVLSERLISWGIEDPRLALFAGARRRNWVASSLALEELAARVRGAATVPILAGRAATVAAYLPNPGLLGLVHPGLAPVPDGRTMEVTVGGVPMRAPAPEVHLAWALRHRQWLDASFVIRHPEMDWHDFVALFIARGRPWSLSVGVATLATLVGPAVPGPVLLAVQPTRWSSVIGRLSAPGGQLWFRMRRRLPNRLGSRAGRRPTS
jgi:hypothetical protein